MMLPDELEWVLEMLGYRWPTANEDKLRDSADLWRKFGDDVTGLHTTANASARQVVAHNAGESIDAFTKTYAKFDGGAGGGGGGDGYLANAATAAYTIANVMEACAYVVEFAKWAVIAQLIALAIEIAAAQAAAPFTFGLSEVGALGATQVTRLIVRRLLDELKEALIEAIVEAMKEPAISAIEAIITDLIRQTVNVGFGAQSGYDLATTVKAGKDGAWEAIKQTPQTLLEGVRDSLGEKAGHRAHHAIDSRIDGYDGGSSGSDGGDGGDGSDGDGGSNSPDGEGSSDSSSSSSSDSSSGDGRGSDSSASTRSAGGTNIGGGISADTGGHNVGGVDLGSGPGSDSGSGSDSGNGGSTPDSYARPAPTTSGPTLSDFDDPSPSGGSHGGGDSGGGGAAPSTSGPSHSGGGSSVSGLSSPTPHTVSASASSGGGSPSTGGHGGGISTSVDSLAASAPTHTNAAPTPTASDPSAAGAGGGRADGGSAIPTSPVAPSVGGGGGGGMGGSHQGGGTSGSSASGSTPTSPTANSGAGRGTSVGASVTSSSAGAGSGPASTPSPNSGAARTPSASASTAVNSSAGTGTGPTSTPSPNSGAARTPSASASTAVNASAGAGSASTASASATTSTPRSSTSTPAADGRTQGPADGRPPAQRTPGTPLGDATNTRSAPGNTNTNTNTTPGDGTSSRNTPGTRPGDGTVPRDSNGTRPGDGTTTRNTPGTTPGDRTTPRGTTDPSDGTRTRTPGQTSTTTTTPNQNSGQSTAPRTSSSPSSGTSSTTTPSTSGGSSTASSGSGSDRTSTSNNGTSNPASPSSRNPNSTAQPGPAAQTTTPGTTPGRPPQPSGGTPNTPPPPAGQSSAPSPSQQTPSNSQQQQHQQQVTPVPVPTVVRTPSAPAAPSHAGPATPNAPASPMGTPGDPNHQQNPDQDSLENIRADLDHYPGGLTQPDPADQQALADAVPRNEDGTPQRYPDPFGNWSQLQNDGGNTVPGRSNNCADCSRSFLETWYGNPQVSAPRTLDLDANGKPDYWSPEDNANDNQIRWAGAPHTYAGRGDDPDTPARIAWDLQQAGHGSAAIVQVGWPNNGGGHAFNAVNHHGNIIWIDTQTGDVSHTPLHITNADHVWHIPLDPNGNPLHPAVPAAQNNGQGQPEDSQNNGGDADGTQAPQNDASGDAPKKGDDNPAQTSTPGPDTTNTETETGSGHENDRPASESDDSSSEQRHPDTPTETHSQNDGTPQHTADPQTNNAHATDPRATDPRTPDPRTADPRTPDPRTPDPRTPDPRTPDPRTPDPRPADPNHDAPAQKHTETAEHPDGRRPDSEPAPDQKHPGDAQDPRSQTPDHDHDRPETTSNHDRPGTPDHARAEGATQSVAGDHRDRPGRMTKDSEVPVRESLPESRNADAAGYVKDSVDGKKPLYGDIAAEQPAQQTQHTQPPRPAHPEHPSTPAEPAGDGSGDPDQRRQRDLDMLARANSNDPKDKAWFEKYYHPRSGYRRSVTAPAEDGRPVPQLHPTNDPNTPWMLAKDAPEADPESYIDEGADSGERHTEISDENLKRLDRAAKERQDAIDADNQPHKDRKAAKDAYEANKTPENLKKFEDADAKHSPLHGKMTRASEDYGEAVAEHHAMPRHFPDYKRVDDRAMGNNRFDQIYRDPNTDPPHYVVVEAKGSLEAELGDRRGLAPEAGSDQPVPPDGPGHGQGDGAQNDDGQDSQDAPGPGVPRVRQGTRAYFETILHEMEARSRRNERTATTDAELEAAQAERKLARDLRKALEADPPRVKYILVKGNSSGGEHQGYEMKQFDIRTEAEKARDADSAT
ncbi:toxin glutamine deamidase domain-containing protein [Streptomyces sp. NPDC047081]|uniref:toxin glutamine deamidase domain-containing protein n=1 Tax=Streptomyces sp. NPDC047081 TaxID=3154706 RepID=UPI0033FA73A3